MAGTLSKTLFHCSRFLPCHSLKAPLPIPISSHRHWSSKAQLIEIDLDSSSSSSSSSSSRSGGQSDGRADADADADAATLKRLDDMVRRIIVQKSTPDWLPFIPGSSFWVPPQRSATSKIADMVDKLNNQLTDEESLWLISLRGWPCSSFLLPQDDTPSTHQVDLNLEFQIPGNDVVEVKVELLASPDNPTDSENGAN